VGHYPGSFFFIGGIHNACDAASSNPTFFRLFKKTSSVTSHIITLFQTQFAGHFSSAAERKQGNNCRASESEASTMAEVVKADEAESATPGSQIIADVKKDVQKSAEGTKKVIQATKDLPSAAAKATTAAVAKAGKLEKQGVLINNGKNSPLRKAEKNGSEGMSLVSPSSGSDVMVDQPIKNNDASAASTSTGRMLVDRRMLDFLTADVTIIIILSFSMALVLTFRSWKAILNNQVPLSVAGSWALLTYAVGHVFPVPKLKTSRLMLPPSRIPSSISESSFDSKIDSQVVGTPSTHCIKGKEEKAVTHRFFLKLFGLKQRKEINLKGVPESASKTRPSWTNLQPNRVKVHRWEKGYDPTKDTKRRGDLIGILLKNKSFRRGVRPHPLQEEQSHSGFLHSQSSTDLGAFDPSQATADSLDDFVIEPILKLRGMDVFLADQLESHVASHPWLISQGLRDVPTLVVNVLTQWGHILVYFEMPDWVQDWNSIVEDESDPDDVKALKRFLIGDSIYRNERLKLIPSIVEGPLAVKVLAPPKKEVRLNCASLPVSWQQYDPEITSKGRKLCPALEVTWDCVSGRSMRTMASIVKRNLHYLSVDMAIVIGQPKGKEEDELIACLGLWRMDHIEVSTCPHFPDYLADEASSKGQDPDVLRATKLVSMTSLELEELAAQ
jgi:hypothetical protein